MKSKLLLLFASLVVGPLCGSAFAQDTGFFAEGIAGSSSYSIDTSRFISDSYTVTSTDKSSISLGIRGGYRFNSIFAFEAGYVDGGHITVRGVTGTVSATSATTANPYPGLPWSVHIHTQLISAGAIAQWPLSDKLVVTGRFGILGYQQDWGKNGGDPVPKPNPFPTGYNVFRTTLPDQQRGVKDYFGVNIGWAVKDHWSLTLGADRYLAAMKFTAITGGIKVTF